MRDPRRRRVPPRRSFTLSGPVVMASCPGPSELRFEDDHRYFAETSKFQSIANAQKGIVLWYEDNSVQPRSRITIYTKVQHSRIAAASHSMFWDFARVRGMVMQSSRCPDRTVRRNRREPGCLISMAANISAAMSVPDPAIRIGPSSARLRRLRQQGAAPAGKAVPRAGRLQGCYIGRHARPLGRRRLSRAAGRDHRVRAEMGQPDRELPHVRGGVAQPAVLHVIGLALTLHPGFTVGGRGAMGGGTLQEMGQLMHQDAGRGRVGSDLAACRPGLWCRPAGQNPRTAQGWAQAIASSRACGSRTTAGRSIGTG